MKIMQIVFALCLILTADCYLGKRSARSRVQTSANESESAIQVMKHPSDERLLSVFSHKGGGEGDRRNPESHG